MGTRLDAELRRARTGDPRAFQSLTEILGPPLVRYVRSYLGGDVHGAHDVVQETLLEAWRILDRLESAAHLVPWCYRVARCRAVRWLRRRGPRGLRVETLDACDELLSLDGAEIPSRRVSGRARQAEPADDRCGHVRRAVDDLPVSYGAAIRLHYLHGLGTRELAELLGVPRTTVKMRLHRARRALRKRLVAEPPPRPSRATPTAGGEGA